MSVPEKAQAKAAADINVRVYHNLLIWPVLLRGEPSVGDAPRDTLLDRWIAEFGKIGWSEKCPEPSYEETVYFHPYVRDFLFGDGKTKPSNRALRRMVRSDLHQVEVKLSNGDDVKLQVERAELYLCKPLTAILVVEVSNRLRDSSGETTIKSLTLKTALDFQDQFRRQYPPFWWDVVKQPDPGPLAPFWWEKKANPTPKSPGLCPNSVTWLDTADKPNTFKHGYPINGERDIFADFTLKGAAIQTGAHRGEFLPAGYEPPVFDHWQIFFGPNIKPVRNRHNVEGFEDSKDGSEPRNPGLFYQQIMDERMPAMSYFAVDNPHEISEGDYDRITFFDSSGTDPYPYNRKFLKRSRADYTYDRFSHLGTTYVCSGYAFAAVGQYDAESPYAFFTRIALTHFRRHYFDAALIAHYQRATLLYYAEEISDSMKLLEGKGPDEERRDPKFLRRIEDIQQSFMKFRSRGYFTEVSNQVQGRELFALWFKHLGTAPLFEQVDATSQRLLDNLSEWQSRSLTTVATAAVPIGLYLALLSTPLIESYVKTNPVGYRGAWFLGVVVALFSLVLLFFKGLPEEFLPPRPQQEKR